MREENIQQCVEEIRRFTHDTIREHGTMLFEEDPANTGWIEDVADSIRKYTNK